MLSKSTIGVQQISPRAATEWQGGHHAPERQDKGKNRGDEPPEDSSVESHHAQLLPGLGQIVDRSV